MATPSWYFTRRRPSTGRARNSQVDKFFRSDVVEDQTNAIIREGIQNSLDAGIAEASEIGKCVTIRISFGTCSRDEIAEFVPGLFDHLEALRHKLPNIPDRSEICRYLVFEDFNTSGLKGDPLEWDPPDNKNAFFNFFRGEGVTGKEGNQRGRHGVGKLVFSAASRARSIFGLTTTADRLPSLMGTSTLELHRCGSIPYDPDGWYGVEHPIDDDSLVGPVTTSDVIGRFSHTFGLEREAGDGLSVVVPWLHETVTPDSALIAVVKGFFWPLMQKSLYVEIANGIESKTILSADTLSHLVGQIVESSEDPSTEISRTYDLARWALSVDTELIPSANLPASNVPSWDTGILSLELKDLLREKLLNEQPVALRMPICIRKKRESPAEAYFTIYLCPDSECPDGHVQYIREGLLIPGVKCRRYPGYRALVIIDDGALASFLGDAENPSHTEWQAQNIKDKYSYADATLRYVVQSVPNLLKALREEQKTADPTLLLHLFSVPTITETAPKKKHTKKTQLSGDASEKPEIDLPPPPAKRYTLQKHESGFVIRRGNSEAPPPQFIDVFTAYVPRRGKPLKKYRRPDFRLNSREIHVVVEGGLVVVQEDNHLRVNVLSPEFCISVTGFDTNRDLYIDVLTESAQSEDANGEEI